MRPVSIEWSDTAWIIETRPVSEQKTVQCRELRQFTHYGPKEDVHESV